MDVGKAWHLQAAIVPARQLMLGCRMLCSMFRSVGSDTYRHTAYYSHAMMHAGSCMITGAVPHSLFQLLLWLRLDGHPVARAHCHHPCLAHRVRTQVALLHDEHMTCIRQQLDPAACSLGTTSFACLHAHGMHAGHVGGHVGGHSCRRLVILVVCKWREDRRQQAHEAEASALATPAIPQQQGASPSAV